MRLKRLLRSSVAAACIAATAAPASWAAPTASAGAAPSKASQRALDVKVAQSRDFSRVEFHWRGGARMTSRRDGQKLILRFNRDAGPDLSRLRVDPPRWIKTAEARHVGGVLELVITLADDADAQVGAADGAWFVNAFVKPPPAPAPAQAEAEPATTVQAVARPNPVPKGGVVRMIATVADDQVQLAFPWAAPNGAAVFRRGDAIWVVFDAAATLDVGKTPRGVRQFSSLKAYRGADYSAVRIAAPASIPVVARSEGSTWTISLGFRAAGTPSQIKIERAEAGGPGALTAAVAGVTKVVQVDDPAVGDKLWVAAALGPAKGLRSRREFVQAAFLPSAQGLALESYIDDLAIAPAGDLLSIGRPSGLTLSPAAAHVERAAAEPGAPQPAGLPALIDYENWGKTGSGGFMSRYGALVEAAAEEGVAKDASVNARMALARFLVGSELSYEAIGVLNDLGRTRPEMMHNPEFRGLRGAAKVMARRYDEAAADFAAPILADDPSSALWRAYLSATTAHWADARQAFVQGAPAFSRVSPTWQARFARADAEAALELGDLNGAAARIRLAAPAKVGPLEILATRLLQARILEAMGQTDRALMIYDAVRRAPDDSLAAPALLRATQIRYREGKLAPVKAAAVLDGLRYRWRGDATELQTIRALGELYLSQGRYREALEALRSAGAGISSSLPDATALQADLSSAFRTLFLDGLADGLEPVQALALFYDFKELTPIGADGDLMVRRLVRRLVDVDLLSQAADLLKYQADNRLDGVAKAQVATDLALIYLMDRKPEDALGAINGSRTTILPSALNTERRLIEARALMSLGRLDHAMEVIERDASKDAADLRAELTWREKDWAAAGAQFEKVLGDRWQADGPLTVEEEGKLLRAGVAYSLAGDETALERMNGRYQRFFAQARNPEALRVALSGVGGGPLSAADFGRSTADSEAFAGWVSRMKQRFREPPAPLPAKPAPPTKQAAAETVGRG